MLSTNRRELFRLAGFAAVAGGQENS